MQDLMLGRPRPYAGKVKKDVSRCLLPSLFWILWVSHLCTPRGWQCKGTAEFGFSEFISLNYLAYP